MAWTEPRYSLSEVNWAGSYLVGHPGSAEPDFDHAIDIVNNFRIAHALPLNTLQTYLRTQAKRIDTDAIVAQRLKRFVSTYLKLRRFPQMRLSQMQDIGGCRAIVANLAAIDRLVHAFKSSRVRHKLVHEDDYVRTPRDSGYRSRHLVYRYMSENNKSFNGLKVEIQIRTPLQHAWATAVETVDAFTEQALKSSKGQKDWARFFQLMGTEMAFAEGTTPVPGTPTDRPELRKDIRSCAEELQVITRLSAFAAALNVTRQVAGARDTDYLLLSLDYGQRRLRATSYRSTQLDQASRDYATEEREIRAQEGKDTVLVSVDSIRNLSRAFPNYFADTHAFVRALREALSESTDTTDHS